MKEKFFSTDRNEAYAIRHLIEEALMSEYNPGRDGEPTMVVIEHPDGSYEPVHFAWYDKENNIVRLSYKGDDE